MVCLLKDVCDIPTLYSEDSSILTRWNAKLTSYGTFIHHRGINGAKTKSSRLSALKYAAGAKSWPLLAYYDFAENWHSTKHKNCLSDTEVSGVLARGLMKSSQHKIPERDLDYLRRANLDQYSEVISMIEHTAKRSVEGLTDFTFKYGCEDFLITFENSKPFLLSDAGAGHRTLLMFIIDVCLRAYLLNPHFGAAAAMATEGVVIIDNLEAHMHPKLQRSIVACLKSALPRVQYVCATHSPFILQTLKYKQVADLTLEEPSEITSEFVTYSRNASVLDWKPHSDLRASVSLLRFL
jgi:predicted ATP-binding protein involved in virulence